MKNHFQYYKIVSSRACFQNFKKFGTRKLFGGTHGKFFTIYSKFNAAKILQFFDSFTINSTHLITKLKSLFQLAKKLPRFPNLGIIRLSAKNVEYKKTYEIYGWGSGKFEDPKNELWNVPMSSNLKKIEIEVTNRGVCEKLLERDLRPNQICGRGIKEGETAAQVINFDYNCLIRIFLLIPNPILLNLQYF